MSGTLPLAEALVASVAARLEAELSGVVVERSRRSPVDLDAETLPRVVVRVADEGIDPAAETDATSDFWRLPLVVVGYVAGDTSTEAEQAVSDLHARVSAALSYWTPTDAGLTDLAEQAVDFVLHPPEDAARPAASFTAPYNALGVSQNGVGPWSS